MNQAKTVFLFLIIFTLSTVANAQGSKIVTLTIKDKNDAKRFEIDVAYPALADKSAAAGVFNKAVKDHVMENVDEFRQIVSEMTDQDRKFLPEGVNYTLDMGYTVEYAGPKFISVSLGKSTYTGGAHPNHWTSTVNFDVTGMKVLQLSDLFKSNSDWLQKISDLAIADLKAERNELTDDEWIERGAGPAEDNFKSWAITKEGLKLFFDPYQVGPYAAGGFEAVIPYNKIPVNIASDLFFPVSEVSYIDGNPPNSCRDGFFARQDADFLVRTIKGGMTTRAHFYSDEDDCPKGKNCRKKAYVVGGDSLVVSRTYGGFACAWYQPAKGNETVGWIKLDDLLPGSAPESRSAFTGEWEYRDSNLSIANIGVGALSVKGNAYWKGLGDNIHIGEVDSQGTPVGKLLTIRGNDGDECALKLRSVGEFLVVSDNKKCGGVNVTFDGVYRKTK